ncbi:EFR1 family ferrodoxin [uncultured Dubosiella sp.]|uniref:EFR1 family ferrodoxin n=2 Tax=uncultured Dubosiella sp. TaxID=1937011 RepID=UPI002081AA22|nr:EFR1 family ferrodoxin [uncultured Dubosiella sp.]GJM57236.1 flavodoxin [Erysipelotrichaceae bacterium OPF54]
MILYFSATGNIQYAVQQIAKATGDTIVSIRNHIEDEHPRFHLKDHENFGIVMPTYFQGLPAFVQDFLKMMKLTMDGTDHYAYSVATCGMSDGNFGSQAVKAMKNSGLALDSTLCIRMVDNWNPHFDMTDRSYIEQAEQRTETDIEKVCAQIAAKEKGIFLPDHFGHDKEEELAKAYEQSRKTENFTVNESCIGCGMCARQCPVHAIGIKHKSPEWIKEQCILCLGCVHKCPKNAIAYTENTIGHGQYTNPNIKTIK